MALLDLISERNTADSSTKQPAIATDAHSGIMEDAFVSSSISQKLDADLYSAIDTGDGADGLSGSGNLNFLTLQAQQNDLLGNSLLSSDNTQGQEVTLGGLGSALASKNMPPASGLFYAGSNGDSGGGSAENIAAPQTISINSLAGSVTTQGSNRGNPDNAFAPDGIGGAVVTGIDGGNGGGRDGQSCLNGIVGPQGISGNNGLNGTNGIDGTGGGGDCCDVNIDIDINNLGDVISLNPVITTITTIINPLLPLLGGDGQAPGDTDLRLNLGLSEALDLETLPVIGGIVGDITTALPVVGSLLDSVDGVLTQNIPVMLDPVESIIGDIDIDIDASGQSLLEGGSLSLGLDGVLGTTDLAPLDITLPLPDTLGMVEDILADPAIPVEALTGNLNETFDGVTDLLSGDQPDNDTDLSLDLGLGDALGLGELPVIDSLLTQNVDISLNPLESIVGDIDLGVAATAQDLLEGGSANLALNGLIGTAELSPLDILLPLPDASGLTDHLLDADISGALDMLAEPLAIDLPDTLGSLLHDGADLSGVLSDPTAAWPQAPVDTTVENTIDSVLGSVSSDGLIAPTGSVAEGLGLLEGLGGTAAGGAGGGGLLGGLFG